MQALARPSLRLGWAIFASRPISLVAALIVAVVLLVTSFGLLAPPILAGYYHAVRASRRERFLIDLERVLGAVGELFRGIGRHFGRSYLLALGGLLVPLALMLAPAVLLELRGPGAAGWAIALQVLFLPAFAVAGATLLHAVPALVSTDAGTLAAARHALAAARRRPWPSLAVGFLFLFPIPGVLIHLLMVFSYPLLAASAVAATGDESQVVIPPRTPRRAFAVTMALALVAGAVLGYRFGGGVGVVFWLGLWVCFLIMSLMASWALAARLLGFALGYAAFILGGGAIVARIWGDAALGPWTALCIAGLVVALRLLARRVE